jgi:hypothetical protein
MKVFYAPPNEMSGIPGGDLETCVQNLLENPIPMGVRSLDDNPPRDGQIRIAPGQACFFLGGRKSLRTALAQHSQVVLSSTNETGLALTLQTHIKVNLTTRFGKEKTFLKNLKFALSKKNWAGKLMEDLDKLSEKTLTVLMVYIPEEYFDRDYNRYGGQTVRVMGNEVTLGNVNGLFAEYLLGVSQQKNEQRLEIINGMFVNGD